MFCLLFLIINHLQEGPKILMWLTFCPVLCCDQHFWLGKLISGDLMNRQLIASLVTCCPWRHEQNIIKYKLMCIHFVNEWVAYTTLFWMFLSPKGSLHTFFKSFSWDSKNYQIFSVIRHSTFSVKVCLKALNLL